jgi:hypothetical protein
VKRREFIAGLGGAAAWPVVARAQQSPMRRIAVLMNLVADDPEIQARLAPFLQGLQEVGWTVGRNVRIDYRWGAGDPDRIRRFAAELVALAPDVVLASGGTIVAPLQQVSRTVPIVFVNVTDPVGSGFVASLGRPGGNATGFTLFEYSISGKWLELLTCRRIRSAPLWAKSRLPRRKKNCNRGQTCSPDRDRLSIQQRADDATTRVHRWLRQRAACPVGVGNPVVDDLLKYLAGPEGNVTGTRTVFQWSAGKWLKKES